MLVPVTPAPAAMAAGTAAVLWTMEARACGTIGPLRPPQDNCNPTCQNSEKNRRDYRCLLIGARDTHQRSTPVTSSVRYYPAPRSGSGCVPASLLARPRPMQPDRGSHRLSGLMPRLA